VRAFIPSYQLISPASLRDALDALARDEGVWQPFAGGTDLMVLLEAGKLPHKNYLNIWNLSELRGLEVTDSQVTLGALTTYTEIQGNETLRTEFPMLCQAATETGGLAIQNRGTIGGNIVNASPAADSPPALLVYDAELEFVSVKGSRTIPYHSFHKGYKQMDIRPDELLRAIRLPRVSNPEALTHYYRKVGTRKAQAISKICFAGLARMDGDQISHVRIALGSVAPIPIRCEQTESALRNQRVNAETVNAAKSALTTEIAPIDDLRSTRDYRLRVALNLLEDFVQQVEL
jgi:CO/xanthine dehydrogenase FAD-binding subunit